MNIQKIKQHKILYFLNFLAVILIILGSTTSFFTAAGTSISGGIQTWGFLLLIIMVFVDGLNMIIRSFKKPSAIEGAATPPQSSQKNRIQGSAVLVGAVLGILIAYNLSNSGSSSGGDDMAAGLVFIFFAPILATVCAIVLLILVKVLYRKS